MTSVAASKTDLCWWHRSAYDGGYYRDQALGGCVFCPLTNSYAKAEKGCSYKQPVVDAVRALFFNQSQVGQKLLVDKGFFDAQGTFLGKRVIIGDDSQATLDTASATILSSANRFYNHHVMPTLGVMSGGQLLKIWHQPHRPTEHAFFEDTNSCCNY